MSEIFSIIFDVIGPIFIVAGLAMLIGWRFDPDPRAISNLLIYLFTPALVLRGLAETDLPPDALGGVVVVTVGVFAITTAVSLVLARWLKLEPRQAGAFLLVTTFVNAANYGIPLNTFAFGETGGEVAIVYYVASIVLGNFFGVIFASRGSVPPREAVLNVLRVPISYAAVIGLLLNVGEVTLPLPLERALDLAADAAIPAMLALLGLQLMRTLRGSLRGQLTRIAAATGTRLILGPLIALPLALLLGLEGVVFAVVIVQSSMPTAVLTNALATEFGSDAEFTSAVTFTTTLASVVTLSVLLSLLL